MFPESRTVLSAEAISNERALKNKFGLSRPQAAAMINSQFIRTAG
jgi:hypothetical protein